MLNYLGTFIRALKSGYTFCLPDTLSQAALWITGSCLKALSNRIEIVFKANVNRIVHSSNCPDKINFSM